MNNFVQILYKNGSTQFFELTAFGPNLKLAGNTQEYVIIKMIYGNMPIVHDNMTPIEKILCSTEFFDVDALTTEDFVLWGEPRLFAVTGGGIGQWKYVINPLLNYATSLKQDEISQKLNVFKQTAPIKGYVEHIGDAFNFGNYQLRSDHSYLNYLRVSARFNDPLTKYTINLHDANGYFLREVIEHAKPLEFALPLPVYCQGHLQVTFTKRADSGVYHVNDYAVTSYITHPV